ncbi:MAG: hypothetical protein C0402_09825 [Thermodesulfovibrio sp.]|nr:hypothetical protein [Thermodesulfovibrio sp.]
MKRVTVGLVQINNSFSNQNYFPYSVGLLQVFAQKHLKEPERFEFSLPLFKRIPVDEATAKLQDAEVVAFSAYVWNIRLSLEIARQLKLLKPETLIVFGGPHIPEKSSMAEDFLRSNRQVDLVCHGEGERPFVSILENLEARDWSPVPSVSYLDGANTFIRNIIAERTEELESIPSPYLEGLFDPLMENNPAEDWIALWETNRGCPFSCSYCDWGSATQSRVYSFDLARLHAEIDWFSRKNIEFVYCCDANFGILKRDLEIVNYMAANKKQYGYPKAFSVQNTKNSTDRTYRIQKDMADAGLNKGVTLSLQSLNPKTLRAINRENISLKTFHELQREFTRNGIETYTDIILGLPEETYPSFVDGVSTVIENGQHNRIQFNNLVVLDNAEMGDAEYQKKYGFVIRETKIINLHGSLTDSDDIYETQKLVVGTNTMPGNDWVRARVFGWMTALLHFDKILQIPLIIAHKNCPVRFREMIGIFTDGAVTSPVLSELHQFFTERALAIQQGGAEYTESAEWLNIWWPTDEYILIKLCTGGRLDAFYEEAAEALLSFLRNRGTEFSEELLKEAVTLNHRLIKMPFQCQDLQVRLTHNIWEVYQAALKGVSVPLEKGIYDYRIDRTTLAWTSWDDWCREVIWYGNKKGAYLYLCSRADQG